VLLNFFKPLGNPLVVVSQEKKSKLEPRGYFGKLLGFNVDLKSYKIQLSDGKIINTKNVQFLDFDSSVPAPTNLSDLIEEQQQEKEVEPAHPLEKSDKEEGEGTPKTGTTL
jgi:hypothetical protein